MIPKYNEMYEEVLAALSKAKELRLTDLVDQVSILLNLSEDERNERLANDNCTIIYYRLGWTKCRFSNNLLRKNSSKICYKFYQID